MLHMQQHKIIDDMQNVVQEMVIVTADRNAIPSAMDMIDTKSTINEKHNIIIAVYVLRDMSRFSL